MSSLESQLDSDYNWRTAELGAIKIQILKLDEKSASRRALMRSLWVMLYAHYEGYCKATWDLYLDAIQKEHISYGELVDNLAIVALRPALLRVKASASESEAYYFMTQEFAAHLTEKVEFRVRHREISNLPPEKLCDICKEYGLSATIAQKEAVDLKRLVYFRHQIAHGQSMESITFDEYTKYEDAATNVMTELALSVLDVLNNRKFKRAT